MPDEHSRLSPSSMNRILACPGSSQTEGTEDSGSQAASQGTLAHSFCEQLLNGQEVDIADKEMSAAVHQFVDYVRCFQEHVEVEGTNAKLLVEQRLISQVVPDHGGTVDALIVTDQYLHVIDFKFGLMPVDVVDNKQMLSYLALADEYYPGRKQFFASIVQPRVFGESRRHEFSRAQVDEHAMDIMLIANSTELHAGEHCRFCPLAKHCVELQRYSTEVAKEQFSEPGDWSGERCKEILAMATVFGTLAGEAKTRMQQIIMGGGIVKGWKLVSALSNRCWRDEDATAEALLAKGLASDTIFKKKLLSPAQLEKFSKAYKPFVEENSHRVDKGPTVVEDSSNLPAYNPAGEFSLIE